MFDSFISGVGGEGREGSLSRCRPEKCGNMREMLMKEGMIAPSSQQEQVLGVAHPPRLPPHVTSYALINACCLFFFFF